MTLFDHHIERPEGVTGEVPWAYLGVTIERGKCRWCGEPCGPRGSWCKKKGSCGGAVYQWWFSAKALNRAIFLQDNFTCQICGMTAPRVLLRGREVPEMSGLHMDHIVPIAKGGKTVWSNLQTLCASCNLRKGTVIVARNRGVGMLPLSARTVRHP